MNHTVSLANFISGNLSTKSLASIVSPSLLIRDSEHLKTHVIAVPNNGRKEFLQNYETISPMVVPRSSNEVTHDDEFTLYTVTTFKKHGVEFEQKCREMKWIPRDYKHVDGGKEEEEKEIERIGKNERKVWGEALGVSRTGWSESVMIWIHVLTLRVFVESVLRYGLPVDFVCGLIKVSLRISMLVAYFLFGAYYFQDQSEISQEGQIGSRLSLFIPRRKCLSQRQEGQYYQRRRQHILGNSCCWCW